MLVIVTGLPRHESKSRSFVEEPCTVSLEIYLLHTLQQRTPLPRILLVYLENRKRLTIREPCASSEAGPDHVDACSGDSADAEALE